VVVDFGKTKLMVALAANAAAKGKKAGVFTPEYKQLQEPYEELLSILQPIRRRASKTEGTIRTTTGGLVDFWQLTDNDLAGRGREYDLVLIDEAAFTKNVQMLQIWERSIVPTMLTTRGVAWAFSTPNGIDPQNFFWKTCNDPEMGFKEFHAPTDKNPYVPADEFEKERTKHHPLVFAQEFEALFSDFSGAKFFSLEKFLVNGKGVDLPATCDTVFITIDTASKSGPDRDGTAVCFWAVNKYAGTPLVLLDWEIVSIDGDLMITWLPTMFQRAVDLARKCKARTGFTGALIEDKAAGMVLLQHGTRNGWPVAPIDSKFTSIGKDERAIAVSGHVHAEKVKIAQVALDKQTLYKNTAQNHFCAQFFGYQVGVKNQADDLADAGVYGIAAALGNSEGF